MLACPVWASSTRATSTSGSGRSSRVNARTAEYDRRPWRNASATIGRRCSSWATRSFSKAVERAMLVRHTSQATHDNWPSRAHHPSRSNSANCCSQRASARSISASPLDQPLPRIHDRHLLATSNLSRGSRQGPTSRRDTHSTRTPVRTRRSPRTRRRRSGRVVNLLTNGQLLYA